MPPPRPLKKGDRIFCLLKDTGRYSYEIVFQGHTGQSVTYVTDVGVDWLSDPDEDHGDELLVIEVKVLKRLTQLKQKTKVNIE